jgi:YD repeat-containing protein
MTYTYDANGQLVSVKSNSGTQQVIYDRDQDGRKRATENFPPRLAERNAAVGAITWEGSDLQFPPPPGGTITTIYDQQNRPVEGQVRDASGDLTMRIVRTYDNQGKINSDKLIPEETQTRVPEQLASQLNDVQKKAMAGFIASAFYTGESGYKYDSQGRVIEKHRIGGVVGETFTTIAYNDHGDIKDELTVEARAANPGGKFEINDAGELSPISTSEVPEERRTETHYKYEYDAQDNWTKRTTTSDSGKGQPTTSEIVERMITYYQER